MVCIDALGALTSVIRSTPPGGIRRSFTSYYPSPEYDWRTTHSNTSSYIRLWKAMYPLTVTPNFYFYGGRLAKLNSMHVQVPSPRAIA